MNSEEEDISDPPPKGVEVVMVIGKDVDDPLRVGETYVRQIWYHRTWCTNLNKTELINLLRGIIDDIERDEKGELEILYKMLEEE